MTCAAVSGFAGPALSPQKPRALMISAGLCGFASAATGLALDASLDGCTACASADASCKAAGICGLGRGVGAAGLAAATATGLASTAATASSSSSFDLPPLNSAARNDGFEIVAASSPLPRLS